LIDQAIAAYDAVLRMNPRNVLSANNLAALLADFTSRMHRIWSEPFS
jgi:hypothetical protein